MAEDQDDFPAPYGNVTQLAFGKYVSGPFAALQDPYIEVWMKDPDTGVVTTYHWKSGQQGALFERIAQFQLNVYKHALAVRNIQADTIARAKEARAKPVPPTLDFKDLLK